MCLLTCVGVRGGERNVCLREDGEYWYDSGTGMNLVFLMGERRMVPLGQNIGQWG